MSHTIEIDDEVFDALKHRAEPLVDTPNSVLRRVLGLHGSHDAGVKRVPTHTGPHRPKLNQRALLDLGVSHFEVDASVPTYGDKRAHPRAYLDGVIAAGRSDVRYYERSMDEGRPNPRGDAASRVILKIGADDTSSSVHFHDGRRMTVADFVQAFLRV